MELFITTAITLTATVYGYGEKMCGDVESPVACARGATTASGMPFDPAAITAAIPAPANRILRPFYVCFIGLHGRPVRVLVNDKANPRWIGQRGFDLTPGAWKALGYTPTKTHSATLEVCNENK